MEDLDTATRLERTSDSTFTTALSPAWEIWGPNGGYLAAVALRAAGVQMQRARPVSLTAHFVGAGASRSAEIAVTINRATKVATSATVTITQDERPLLVAVVWGSDDGLPGLTHHTSSRPQDVPPPESLRTVAELTADIDGARPHPFWDNVEERPTSWIADWESRSAAEPERQSWYRFVPTATFSDPWVDAARSLILIDLDSWPAATMAHLGELDHYAPTVELNARFAGSAAEEPWLLSRAAAPVATDGLIAATGEIWSPSGRLLALGGSTLLCRPAARRPDR